MNFFRDNSSIFVAILVIAAMMFSAIEIGISRYGVPEYSRLVAVASEVWK